MSRTSFQWFAYNLVVSSEGSSSKQVHSTEKHPSPHSNSLESIIITLCESVNKLHTVLTAHRNNSLSKYSNRFTSVYPLGQPSACVVGPLVVPLNRPCKLALTNQLSWLSFHWELLKFTATTILVLLNFTRWKPHKRLQSNGHRINSYPVS